MKSLLILIFLIVSTPLFSQTKYKTWVIAKNTDLLGTGYLYELNDSSIRISYSAEPIDIRYIKNIQFRDEYRRPKKALLGALIGSATFVALSKKPCEGQGTECFIGNGLFGMSLGGVMGLVIGSTRITIPIGSIGTYREKRNDLKKYLAPSIAN